MCGLSADSCGVGVSAAEARLLFSVSSPPAHSGGAGSFCLHCLAQELSHSGTSRNQEIVFSLNYPLAVGSSCEPSVLLSSAAVTWPLLLDRPLSLCTVCLQHLLTNS